MRYGLPSKKLEIKTHAPSEVACDAEVCLVDNYAMRVGGAISQVNCAQYGTDKLHAWCASSSDYADDREDSNGNGGKTHRHDARFY